MPPGNTAKPFRREPSRYFPLLIAVGLLWGTPVLCAAVTPQQLKDYIQRVWELTDLTDEVIVETLNTTYEGIPFKEYVTFLVAAPDIVQPLAQGDYRTAARNAANLAKDVTISAVLKHAGLASVAAPARLAYWPIEYSLSVFSTAVSKKSFQRQLALYFEAREFNSYRDIKNRPPGELLDGVAISKTD